MTEKYIFIKNSELKIKKKGSGLSFCLFLSSTKMTRPLRLEYPDALYHITSRGDGRDDIFFDDNDRRAFLDIFAETQERFNWVVHA